MATVDMQPNEILHLADTLTAECGAYKRRLAEDISASYNAGVYCYECAFKMKRVEEKF